MLLRIAIVATTLTTVFGCSEPLTERNSSDDTVVPPVGITGGYLADYNNARLRCKYANPAHSALYEITCNVTIQVDGREIIANKIDANTTISWQSPIVKFGGSSELNCEVDSTKLLQTCKLETKSSTVKLEFSFNISSGKQNRKESIEVLLPYSVEVAAEYVPNLGYYLGKGPNSEKKDVESPEFLGFQTPEINQNSLKLNIGKSTSCISPHGFYFSDGTRSIYKFNNGIVKHFAGSAFDLGVIDPTHALRIRFKQIRPQVACTDEGIYVHDLDKIYFIDKKGNIAFAVNSSTFGETSFSMKNFSSLPSGELFFQIKYDLLKFNPTVKKTEIIIQNFNVSDMPEAFNKPYLYPNRGIDFFASSNGDYFYRTHVRINNTTTSIYALIRQRGDAKTIVSSTLTNQSPNYYEYPVETFGAPLNSGSDFAISPKGEVFYFQLNNSKFDLKKVGLDSKVHHVSTVPFGLEFILEGSSGIRILHADEDDNVYALGVLKGQIVKFNHKGVLTPFDLTDNPEDSMAIKTAISPTDVSFLDGNSFAFFNEKNRKLMRYDDGKLSVVPLDQECAGVVSSSIDKSGKMSVACQRKIYSQTSTGP